MKQLERLRLRWRDNIKWFFNKSVLKAWTGLFWLTIGIGDGLL
jgi:hypothetical protein